MKEKKHVGWVFIIKCNIGYELARAQAGCSMDASLDVTKTTWVVKPLDKAWALHVVLKRFETIFNSKNG